MEFSSGSLFTVLRWEVVVVSQSAEQLTLSRYGSALKKKNPQILDGVGRNLSHQILSSFVTPWAMFVLSQVTR